MNNHLVGNKKEITILSIMGTRPNFMKIAPIAHAIEKYNKKHVTPHIKHIIIHTGQHYDEAMSQSFFDDLQMPAPNMNLEVGSASHAVQTARIMERFEPILLKEQPDILLVVGDVNSTIACALVASKIKYPSSQGRSRPLIAHVEAGLRSFDRDMPEEINRILTDTISDLLFVTEESAIDNLKQEGVSADKIHFVGNTMIDSLILFKEKALQSPALTSSIGSLKNLPDKYGIVTLHRPSNVDEPSCLSSLVNCLLSIANKLPLIFPMHPRTKNNLEVFGLSKKLSSQGNIFLTQPLGYLQFLKLLISATLILTDSGGIQEETTFLQIPCVTLRENTERPVTTKLGTNYLVGIDPKNILKKVSLILDGKSGKGSIPPFWDGRASERIIDILRMHI